MIVNNQFNECLGTILSFLPGLAYLKNKEGVFIGCNFLFARYIGLSSAQEIVGKTDNDLPWKNQADAMRRVELEIMQSGENRTIEEVLISIGGEENIFLSSKTPLEDENENDIGILCSAIEITKYKKRKSRLQVSKDTSEIALENILNNVPAHIFWKDINCILLGCNDLQAKHMGFANGKEMVGKSNYDVIWPNQTEEERQTQADLITKIDLQVMQSGETYTAEEPLVLPDGSTRIYLSKKTPYRNELGKIIGLLGISFDITEQKMIEEELLATKHKLEGMTLVNAAISHELSTPLSSFALKAANIKIVFPYLKAAYLWAKKNGAAIDEKNLVDFTYLESVLNLMQKEIEAAFTFMDIAQKKTDQSIGRGKPEILSISDVIDRSLLRYPFIAKQRDLVHWKRDLNTDFLINSDPVLITHVFFNLIKNAIYYVIKAGKGNIQIWLETGKPYNKLYFKDSGTGIQPEVLPHIFERFFSRADRGTHGAGVGLTFCREVMLSLKGEITCESVEDSYTLFILSFPDNS